MISGAQGLSIRPLSTYSNIENRYTTITGFDEILKEKTNKASNSKGAEETDKEKKVTETEEDDSVIYKDPTTGENVKYVDVSDDDNDKNDNDTKVSSSKNNTTT